ncbi:hypothetical protein ES705_39403 [subsurface metagenome]|jgi:hypothetical protein
MPSLPLFNTYIGVCILCFERLGGKDLVNKDTDVLTIFSRLHPLAWSRARTELPRNSNLETDDEEVLGNRQLPIVNWCETHFRALLEATFLATVS